MDPIARRTLAAESRSRSAPKRKLRVAFIGGRGVISKYSGIEAYYEEVGKRLVEMGHEVTVYCRNYFTPSQAEHNGMRLVRLPTIRSKHLETVVHTLLSTAHALTQSYDVVHYHALGPALFSFLAETGAEEDRGDRAGPGLAEKKMGTAGIGGAAAGRAGVGEAAQRDHGGVQGLQQRYREAHGMRSVLCAQRRRAAGMASNHERFWSGGSSPGSMFCFWEDSRRKKDAICWWRRLSRSKRM